MGKSRRANSVLFGFDFQVNAAIVLMLENMREMDSLRLESDLEDIEIFLSNGKSVLAQAKAVEKSSSDFTNVRVNLKKALESLSEGAYKGNVEKGEITVYVDDGDKKELFTVKSGEKVDTSSVSVNKGSVYVVIKTKGTCTNGSFDFEVK